MRVSLKPLNSILLSLVGVSKMSPVIMCDYCKKIILPLQKYARIQIDLSGTKHNAVAVRDMCMECYTLRLKNDEEKSNE